MRRNYRTACPAKIDAFNIRCLGSLPGKSFPIKKDAINIRRPDKLSGKGCRTESLKINLNGKTNEVKSKSLSFGAKEKSRKE